ncbi:DUF6879 family protein [Streptomyces noursei]|uniref:DUF6879 family protein n=1 Tax=Streptomyces noursei TaxID=1971 RepID=UPI00081CF043|nr:DUF6879 family protein [Streptomyces noursei]ANZ16792.1 hypothetical protein SNOUR_17465 [Streptomyces noursei ATCC 11455]MCZ0993815.1 hypothetical protein [Streptomyces noursei]MCZ1017723.1 hypothetical protein [Streptomyces noursei]GGX56681.1 hypothetical protein GCM10010341_91420 [Streptomyces noursei]
MKYPVREGITNARHSAVHLEMRDRYTPDDPEFARWRAGHRYEGDPGKLPDWWDSWRDLVAETTARGVVMRRARVVSEPVTDYIRYEHDMTFANVAAGELVRWLPRRQAADLVLPGTDLWMFDGTAVLFTYFSGDGNVVDREWRTDAPVVEQVRTAFEAVWQRATPHEEYKPA